jgi:hypothetical protein
MKEFNEKAKDRSVLFTLEGSRETIMIGKLPVFD